AARCPGHDRQGPWCLSHDDLLARAAVHRGYHWRAVPRPGRAPAPWRGAFRRRGGCTPHALRGASVNDEQLLSLSEVFVLLFVMLGPPLKVPALFAARTQGLDGASSRALAWRSFGLAVVASIAGGALGAAVMNR